MNRRDFTRWAFAGTALSAVLDPASLLASTALPARSQQKQNARKTFQGFENSLRPSFSPDFAQLDEAGIRHDVRQSIAHGVFSIFCVPAGLNGAERDQFLQLVADENQGQVLLSTFLGGPTLASHMSQLKSAQAAGFSHVLAHPPGQEPVDSKDSLYAYYRQIADGTDMDVVLWATDGGNMRHLHPSNVVLDVLERVAELDNVVALKVMATLDPVTVFEIFERLNDRLLVNCVDLRMLPLLVKFYGVQWSGAWTIEALQSPQHPYVVDYLKRLREGNYQQADALYWTLKPAYETLMGLMAPMLPRGIHPSVQMKYYQWCVGGNGGLTRWPENAAEREFPLTADERNRIQQAYRAIGIEPQGPEESFVVGRAAYARGVRADQLAETPMYIP